MASEVTTGIVMPIIASVVTAVVVGMGSAYLTASTTMARMDEKMAAMDARVESLEAESGEKREIYDRLIRVETKLDAIMERLERTESGPTIYGPTR